MVGAVGIFTTKAQITIYDYNVVGVGNFVEQDIDTTWKKAQQQGNGQLLALLQLLL